jgi:hypothetical protein
MYLGWIVDIRIDTALKDVFEELWVSRLALSQAGKVDIQEGGTGSQC